MQYLGVDDLGIDQKLLATAQALISSGRALLLMIPNASALIILNEPY